MPIVSQMGILDEPANRRGPSMLYAILCYNSEKLVSAWTQQEDDAVMTQLDLVHQKLSRQGRFGPTARLMDTHTAKTLRKAQGGRPAAVTDGPFVETKEQLLGFYVVESASIEEALDAARALAEANPGAGGYEVRPLRAFLPGDLPTKPS